MIVQAEQKRVPALRFPEFEGEWEEKRLGSLITSLKSGVSVNSEDTPANKSGEAGVLKTSAVSTGRFIPLENKKIIEDDIDRAKLNPCRNSIIISRMNTLQLVGESGYVDRDYPDLFIPDRLWQTKTNSKVNVKWLSYLLINPLMRRKISSVATGTSGSMKNIAKPNFLALAAEFPPLPEQQKIADFLTSIDTRIQQLTRKVALLEQYKKGVMQQIFSQAIRFQDDQGRGFPAWEEKKLGDLIREKTKKTTENNQYEILSSTKEGIYLQREYFNRDIASKDNTGYKILRNNQLVFSPQNLWMGNINVNTKYQIGIVSPSYKIFEFNSDVAEVLFFKDFLKTPRMMYEYAQSSEQGASIVRRNLDMQAFKGIKLSLPTLPEQQKIADFLSAIDRKITHTEDQLKQMQRFKKGLLQQLFV